MNVISDAEVIFRSRDRGAEFEAIFDRHAAAVVRYLRLRVGDDLAEELAAETFAEAFRTRRRFRPKDASALPWLYGIAGNLVRMHWRSEQRRLRAYAQAAATLVPVTPERYQHPGVGSLAAAVSDGLLALPAGQREVLLLHVWGELSLSEIAQALSISGGTVRKRLHRARRFLADRLGAADEISSRLPATERTG
ncbi:hypothetical protein AYO39_01055 [Actinobacteria bacterium SCGC AG-212-D09]|nr:hypothetical protein AYO39_01055 [Actinobacteria bacterium SCGC AG-212-D09]